MRRRSLRGALPQIISLLVFAAAIVWLIIGLSGAQNLTEQQEMESVVKSLEKGITLCYALEGEYPPSVDHLKESYGFTYDADKFIVHYDRFAANIRPSVKVMRKTAE